MGHEKELAAYTQYFKRGTSEIVNDLETFSDLLQRWQKVQNLVSRETLSNIWTRHFVDSLQILKFLPLNAAHFLDLGSGGGLPALPLAIALKGSSSQFTLVEPNGRKVSFLRTVARELELPVTVLGHRSDEIDSRETGQVDVVTCRALAPLHQLLGMAEPFFQSHTVGLFHKGREHVDEIAQTGAEYGYDVLTSGSDTDPHGVILQVRNLAKRPIS